MIIILTQLSHLHSLRLCIHYLANVNYIAPEWLLYFWRKSMVQCYRMHEYRNTCAFISSNLQSQNCVKINVVASKTMATNMYNILYAI